MNKFLKNQIERSKESSIARFFRSIQKWCTENVVKRKVFTFFTLFAVWLGLLLGALNSPQRQLYTREQLKTKQVFSNGTGEINLVSQTYSPSTKIIVLQFETDDATSTISRGIDSKRLEWKLYAQDKSLNTSMEVVPIVDNKISVIIRNVPNNFGAFAIDVINKSVSTSQIDVNISSPSSSNEDGLVKKLAGSYDETEGNTVQFYVATQNDRLERKVIKDVSREEFTLAEIASEKEFQNGQIDKLNKSIESLKKAIEDDESTRESLNLEAKYLTGDDLTENQKDVAILESSIESKNQSIQVATDNIEKVKEKIATLDRKAAAIKDGTFEFSSPIETVEMGK